MKVVDAGKMDFGRPEQMEGAQHEIRRMKPELMIGGCVKRAVGDRAMGWLSSQYIGVAQSGNLFVHCEKVIKGARTDSGYEEVLTMPGTGIMRKKVLGAEVQIVTNAPEIRESIGELGDDCAVKEICKAIRAGGIQHYRAIRQRIRDLARSFTMTIGEGQAPQGHSERYLMTMMSNGDFWDDAKGGKLEPERVKEARKEELRFVHKRNVYEVVPWERALERTGRPPIKTRWVDTNKRGRQ